MQKLLVPTDFSACARQALSYAVALANLFGGHIVLYHAFKMRITSRSFTNVDALLKEDAENRMKSIIEEVSPSLASGVTIQGIARKGEIVTAIAHRAREDNFDLIIMGTEGASGLQDLLFGSTTVGVIDQAECPVLAIPKKAQPPAFYNLVLALDDKGARHPKTLGPLLRIAAAFSAPVRVYHKADPNYPVDMEAIVRRLLGDLPYELHYETTSQNIYDGILAYAKSKNANLLCLIHRKRDFLEKLLHNSITRENLLHSDIPTLILKE